MTMEQKKDKPTQQQVLDAIRAFNNPNPSDCYEKTDF